MMFYLKYAVYLTGSGVAVISIISFVGYNLA